MTTKKTKINGLILGDDIRFTTGVARVIREVVNNTYENVNWTQIGGARIHPEPHTVVNYENKCKIIPSPRGYGDMDFINYVFDEVKPDFIFFVTDPRHFTNLFRLEYKLRQFAPYIYYNIWDNYPVPRYNYPFYKSCDALICINYQTMDIINQVLSDEEKSNKIINYVPHGVDETVFKPKKLNLSQIKDLMKKALGEEYLANKELVESLPKKKVLLWVGKNQHRKHPLDILYAYYKTCGKYKEFKENTVLIMHTNPIAEEGTDLIQSKIQLVEDYGYSDVLFTGNGALNDEELSTLYNVADGFINNSNAEGFGLPVLEAVMCGLPVLHTVTGGIQDQFPYKKTWDENSKYKSRNLDLQKGIAKQYTADYEDEYKGHEWSIPIYPDATTMIGASITPYIYEDRISIITLSEGLWKFYQNIDTLKKNALEYGSKYVRTKFTNKHMANSIYETIEKTIQIFKPRKDITYYKF